MACSLYKKFSAIFINEIKTILEYIEPTFLCKRMTAIRDMMTAVISTAQMLILERLGKIEPMPRSFDIFILFKYIGGFSSPEKRRDRQNGFYY